MRKPLIRPSLLTCMFVAVLGNIPAAAAPPTGAVLIEHGAEWKAYDGPTAPPSEWRNSDFDDSGWKVGSAPLGYGEDYIRTPLSFGDNPRQKRAAIYFRKHFQVDQLPAQGVLQMRIRYDDGFIAYLNGKPLAARNVKPGAAFGDFATASHEGNGLELVDDLATDLLRTGDNVLAVEVHQVGPTSSDLVFDLELRLGIGKGGFYIAPYIQNLTADGVTVLWETKQPGPSEVEYSRADAGDAYSQKAVDEKEVKIHRVRLAGLQPETRYVFRVREGEVVREGTFTTAPVRSRPIRFAVLGDSRFWGTRWQESKLPEHLRSQNPEFLISVGDVVPRGYRYTDWPPHFERFAFPRTPFCIFLARGTHEGDYNPQNPQDWCSRYMENPGEGEPFSSFDWGNCHFVLIAHNYITQSLDRLDRDLASTDKRWKIVAFHYPVYCTGYPSPADKRKASGYPEMEAVLDKHGVTLVLTGHTHIYERSFPLRAGKRDDRAGAVYLVEGGNVGGHFPDWWTHIIARNMMMPYYTLVEMRDDRWEMWTYGLEPGAENRIADARIVEVDHFVRWFDETQPRALVQELESATGAQRLQVIERLGAMMYHGAVSHLLPLLESADAETRRAAALALRRIADESAAPALLQRLRSISDPEVRRMLAQSIECAMPASSGRELKPLVLDSNEDREVRIALLGALSLRAPDVAADIAREALQESDARVQERAADVVKRRAGKQHLKSMAALFVNHPNPYVRACMAWGFNRLLEKRVSVDKAAAVKPDERSAFLQQWGLPAPATPVTG